MEWVETTGRTVEEALDTALDQLGVHEEDAEYEVIEEPKKGLLGRFGGSDARIRARIRPISREKPGERRRRAKGGNRRPEGGGQRRSRSRSGSGERSESGERSGGRSRSATKRPDREPKSTEQATGPRPSREEPVNVDVDDDRDESMPVEEQAEVAAEFVGELVDAIGLQAEVGRSVDDDTILLDVQGAQLGLLVGPKGATLHAIEELARAVVQHESGGHGARVRVDVGGYRAKRRAALADFTRTLAGQVVESGEEKVLEPMSSPDRKVVHDTAAEIDGVESLSEGEEPRRYVVIRPA
jgi:spoIIIJ-associated protein